MNPELWPLISAGLGFLGLVLLLVLLVLAARAPKAQVLEAALREETARAREEAASQARSLREELATGLLGLRQDLVQALERAGAQQEAQLGKFSSQLEVFRRLMEGQFGQFRSEAAENARQVRQEVSETLDRLGQAQAASLEQLGQTQQERLAEVAARVAALTQTQESRLETLRQALESNLAASRQELTTALQGLSEAQGQRLAEVKTELAGIASTVAASLEKLTNDNAQKLEQMRQTVDEKLQGTLEKRLGESFGLVSRQLEMVHKSVGEMQGLASGVGDLKRVLSNVKARGIWGEIQLGNLLEQVFAPEQYARNLEVRPGSGLRVEFAVRLPGKGEGPGPGAEVYLPIDAKFPQEDYERLLEAAERGDKAAEEAAAKALELRLRASAKEICDKYICPPHSTDFAIMYLPTEGLYAEVMRRPGMAEALQREQRVIVAGPMSLYGILNSLQMGFRTLAIQKRSSEVWQVLAAVKTEFGRYGEALDKVRKKLQEAEGHIDKVATRKRVIDRKLKGVQALPDSEAAGLLGLEAPGGETLEAGAEGEEA